MSYLLALQQCMSFICRRNIGPPLNTNPYQDLQEANKRVQPKRKKKDNFLRKEMAQLIDLIIQTICSIRKPHTWKPIMRCIMTYKYFNDS
jgi:hypothetical protein